MTDVNLLIATYLKSKRGERVDIVLNQFSIMNFI